jgi:hypothetical protein
VAPLLVGTTVFVFRVDNVGAASAVVLVLAALLLGLVSFIVCAEDVAKRFGYNKRSGTIAGAYNVS